MNNNFKQWLDTFIYEKGLSMEEIFTLKKNKNLNIMSYQTIYEHMLMTNAQEQKKIKDIIVQIDFLNGDVLKFFKHLGNAIARKEVA